MMMMMMLLLVVVVVVVVIIIVNLACIVTYSIPSETTHLLLGWDPKAQALQRQHGTVEAIWIGSEYCLGRVT